MICECDWLGKLFIFDKEVKLYWVFFLKNREGYIVFIFLGVCDYIIVYE